MASLSLKQYTSKLQKWIKKYPKVVLKALRNITRDVRGKLTTEYLSKFRSTRGTPRKIANSIKSSFSKGSTAPGFTIEVKHKNYTGMAVALENTTTTTAKKKRFMQFKTSRGWKTVRTFTKPARKIWKPMQAKVAKTAPKKILEEIMRLYKSGR